MWVTVHRSSRFSANPTSSALGDVYPPMASSPPPISPWLRMHAVQTRTIALVVAAIGAAVFLDLAVIDVAGPVAGVDAAAPPVTVAVLDTSPSPTVVDVAEQAAPVDTRGRERPARRRRLGAWSRCGGTGLGARPRGSRRGTLGRGAGGACPGAAHTRRAHARATHARAPPPHARRAHAHARPDHARRDAGTTPAPPTPVPPTPTRSPAASTTTIAPASPVAPTMIATTTTSSTVLTSTIEYVAYAIRDVGTVVLAHEGGSTISLASTELGAGWVYRAESDGPQIVKLKFFNTQTRTARPSGRRPSRRAASRSRADRSAAGNQEPR